MSKYPKTLKEILENIRKMGIDEILIKSKKGDEKIKLKKKEENDNEENKDKH